MSPEKIGSIIGGAFGLVFVLVNTGSLPGPVAVVLRILAIVAFVAVLVSVWRVPPAAPSGRGGFGRGYWVVVAIEVVAIFGGLRLISGPLDTPDAAVAWIAFVVGVHFFALAAVWRLTFFAVLAGALAACGVAGLIVAFAGGPTAVIDVIGAVIPGALLLGFALWGAGALPSQRGQRRSTVH